MQQLCGLRNHGDTDTLLVSHVSVFVKIQEDLHAAHRSSIWEAWQFKAFKSSLILFVCLFLLTEDCVQSSHA